MADALTMTASDKLYITTITHTVNNINSKKRKHFYMFTILLCGSIGVNRFIQNIEPEATMFRTIQTDTIPNTQLKHGAIYKLKVSWGSGYLDCRCNICPSGDEVWFTDRFGKEQTGEPIKLLRKKDKSFIHRDQ